MSQLIMILLISLLVLVHEIGHFIAARIFGVRVTRFGIGMPVGPSWKLFKWGHTVFYIHAFLFGGYVSFADDEPEPSEPMCDCTRQEKARTEVCEEILPPDSPELYENKTIAQKLVIVSAGVIMNVIFAIVLVMLAAAHYHKLPASSQNIFADSFASKITSNIQNSGLQKGDKIDKINGQKINTFYQLTFFAKNSKLFDDYAQKDLVQKNLEELKKLNPKLENKIKAGQTLILPAAKPENPLEINENVLKGLEKYKKDGIELNKAQIELRNELYGKKSYTFKTNASPEEVALSLSDTYKPLKITVLREGKEITLKNVIVDKEGLLGVLLKIEDVYTETKTVKQIVVKSLDYLYSTTSTMLFSLFQLITGKVSASDMHGVIAVVKVGGDIIASKGMLNGILLTAMISINLAIMNVLPIPALDGGHIMFLLIEKFTGKKPGRETAEKINNFFFILLIILMISICYNDIFALVTKKL